MHQGACLCGTVRYSLSSDPQPILLCHCLQCRQSTGSAYAAVAPIPAAHFTLEQGRDALDFYESSPGKKRYFCTRCGSPVYSIKDTEADTIRLRLGLLTTPLQQKPHAHIFMAEKASWDPTCDDGIPHYDGWEPGRG